MCYSQIWQNFGDDECKLSKEHINASLCKFVVNSLQHSEIFNVSHVFLPLTIAELSTLKQVHFILAHPVYPNYMDLGDSVAVLTEVKLSKNCCQTMGLGSFL